MSGNQRLQDRTSSGRSAARWNISPFPDGLLRYILVMHGFIWMFKDVPSIVVGAPVTSLYSKDGSPNRLERTAYDLLQRAGNMWELISTSSDVISVRSKYDNGSHPPPWDAWDRKVIPARDSQLSVERRLQKLEHHFNSLRVHDDDCRQRLLCEIAESPAKFAPLTTAFLDETSFNGDEKLLASKLLETNDGTRLLTYIEAAQKGISRQGCEIWTYRCPHAATSMIDFKSLLVWRELSKWLTVKFVAKKQ